MDETRMLNRQQIVHLQAFRMWLNKTEWTSNNSPATWELRSALIVGKCKFFYLFYLHICFMTMWNNNYITASHNKQNISLDSHW